MAETKMNADTTTLLSSVAHQLATVKSGADGSKKRGNNVVTKISPIARLVDFLSRVGHGEATGEQMMVEALELRSDLLSRADLHGATVLKPDAKNTKEHDEEAQGSGGSTPPLEEQSWGYLFDLVGVDDDDALPEESRTAAPARPFSRSSSSPDEFLPVVSLHSLYQDQPPEVLAMLEESALNWHFDSFKFASLVNRPLAVLTAYYLDGRLGLIEALKIDPERFCRFLLQVDGGYAPSTPPHLKDLSDLSSLPQKYSAVYHNVVHAADVLHSLFAILVLGQVKDVLLLSDEELLAALVAAAVHDLQHPGVTNDFLISTGSELAVRYNDRSVLENHHVACAFTILSQSGCNWLHNSKVNNAKFRDILIDMVLATDMKRHTKLMSHFQVQIECSKEIEGGWAEIAKNSQRHKQLMLTYALKVADLGHMMHSSVVHCEWVAHLQAEFWRQGDKELKLNRVLGPMMDRNTTTSPGELAGAAPDLGHERGIPSTDSQIKVGFIDFVVEPCFSHFTKAFPGCQHVLIAMSTNRSFWKVRPTGLHLVRTSQTAE
ncbi:hypothetical protein CYMTET_29944 [Cymbomonas tetramitiformis]|uniref:Phosphodiesterase n=1 Tax=Cymbomonas tetramitiformis TaxID=36881 RepID=A0AAE0KUF2_9CHLO|nr:hypothetical protein CYMTET_29944 [Cymbomonas tetramitiformis]